MAGNPPGSKSACLLPLTGGADRLLRGSRRKKGEPAEVGRREQNPKGPFARGRLGVFSHMASFSLWEHRLSFISVSWMYRITLVSVGCRVLASFR